jgi:DNA-3-methyladenine glycosylase I
MITETRCTWCLGDSLYQHYHDNEWGYPCRDERKLFEFLLLEGAQAGLSWMTILRKRENYRAALANFEAEKIARFTASDIEQLVHNQGIVRNRLKIKSAINNARCYLKLRDEHGSLRSYLWRYLEDTPQINRWVHHHQVPTTTALSDKISTDMGKRGFTFFGSTICYAFMQAMGMVNDHLVGCYRHLECQH